MSIRRIVTVLAGFLVLASAIPAFAQGAGIADCGQSAAQEPATQPAPAAKDGTSPGNAGSSGWSGGLGGSYIGTAPAGTRAGGTVQPATAKGLDLTGATKPPC